MNKDVKMNVLVLNKSTCNSGELISSIAGMSKKNINKYIDIYESNVWPIRCILIKEFGDSRYNNIKLIYMIRKYINNKKNNGIDAIWYCSDNIIKGNLEHDLNLIDRIIKRWKNVPIFLIVTDNDSVEIDNIFYKKDINLKKIISLAPKKIKFNDKTILKSKNVEKLCIETVNCLDEAKEINKENINKLALTQKRYTTNGIVIAFSMTAMGVAYADKTNYTDSTVLTGLEVVMTKIIFKIYGINYSGFLIDKIVGGTVITSIAKYIVGKFDKSQIIDAVVAGTIVFIFGEALIVVSEGVYTGKISTDKISEYVEENIKNNKIVKKVITYLEDNKINLENSTKEEVFNSIKGLFLNN